MTLLNRFSSNRLIVSQDSANINDTPSSPSANIPPSPSITTSSTTITTNDDTHDDYHNNFDHDHNDHDENNNNNSTSTTTTTTSTITSTKSFISCLNTFNEVTSFNGSNLTSLLKRAMSIEELNDTSWLSSTLIDLVFSQFAKQYSNVDYLSIDFLLYTLNSKSNFEGLTDILGRILQYKQHRPVIFLWNQNNIHWTLIRANFLPTPELQLFEPMGKLPSRKKGTDHLSYRYVPRDVVRWLDLCYPLQTGQSWIKVSTSAITNQQQCNSFDCGVACLLYAEKCGLGQTKEIINTCTTQEDITLYRRDLQEFMKKMNQQP